LEILATRLIDCLLQIDWISKLPETKVNPVERPQAILKRKKEKKMKLRG